MKIGDKVWYADSVEVHYGEITGEGPTCLYVDRDIPRTEDQLFDSEKDALYRLMGDKEARFKQLEAQHFRDMNKIESRILELR